MSVSCYNWHIGTTTGSKMSLCTTVLVLPPNLTTQVRRRTAFML